MRKNDALADRLVREAWLDAFLWTLVAPARWLGAGLISLWDWIIGGSQ